MPPGPHAPGLARLTALPRVLTSLAVLKPNPLHRRARSTLRHTLCAVGLVVALAAQATPDEAPAAAPGDAILNLLQERGLVGEQGSAALQTMRDRATDLVMTAMNFLGVPYRRGGNNAEEGFDCSGFTRYIFEHSVGLVLPRRADEQATTAGLAKVERDDLKPGDLVFFNTLRRTFSHVGIYVGDGKFIHAPRTGAKVRVEDMRIAYWAQRFTGARRAELPNPPAAR